MSLSLALASLAASRASEARGPQFWVATRGEARVFIFGFGEARDTSWFTAPIRRAFEQSSQVWLETGGAGTHDSATAARMERLSHESGRTLFEALEPPVRERTLAYMAELGIAKESVETLRPWRAYYAIVSAFFAKRKQSYVPVQVDGALQKLAMGSGKTIGYEMPTRESFVTFMAAMSDKAQSQYIEWLLDFLDDYKQSHDDEETFGWIAGRNLPMRSLDRMRTKMPDLYRVMQPERNLWWARKVDELLATKGTSFIAVGQLHVLGPDGIPAQLKRLGIAVDSLP
jgi:uncharacterized protein